MGFKCVPQCTGLVVGDPKPSKKTGKAPKHRHNGQGWLLECLKERATKSATVDRTKTYLNDYHGLPDSAREFWADFMDELEREHSTTITRKDGVVVTRKFRSDGVPLVGTINNPPEDVWLAMSEDERNKFRQDHLEVMELFEPRLFSRSNIRTYVTHVDEGCDDHISYSTFDENGKCWGHLLDAQLLHNLCEYYPQAMRERGWDLEDLDLTDWSRMKDDEEYATERRAKLRSNRLNTNEYIRKQNEAAALEAAEQRVAAEEAVREAQQRLLEATALAEQKQREADEAEALALEAKKNVDEATASLVETQEKARLAQEKVDAAQLVVEAARDEAEQIRSDARSDAKAIVDSTKDSIQRKERWLRKQHDDLDEAIAKANEVSASLDVARETYEEATRPTVAGISPGYFLRRCFEKIISMATPKKSLAVDGYQNMGTESLEPTRDTSDSFIVNAINGIRKYITNWIGSVDMFGEQVAYEIQREQQGKPIYETSDEIREAEQKQKEMYASLGGGYGSYSSVGGHGDFEASL